MTVATMLTSHVLSPQRKQGRGIAGYQLANVGSRGIVLAKKFSAIF
jgi:hypothetical protein